VFLVYLSDLSTHLFQKKSPIAKLHTNIIPRRIRFFTEYVLKNLLHRKPFQMNAVYFNQIHVLCHAPSSFCMMRYYKKMEHVMFELPVN
jgi:hypothetical protein